MKNWRTKNIGHGRDKSDEPQCHRRNIAADIEAPLAPMGIVNGNGVIQPRTMPGPRGILEYGKAADVRADLELEET